MISKRGGQRLDTVRVQVPRTLLASTSPRTSVIFMFQIRTWSYFSEELPRHSVMFQISVWSRKQLFGAVPTPFAHFSGFRFEPETNLKPLFGAVPTPFAHFSGSPR